MKSKRMEAAKLMESAGLGVILKPSKIERSRSVLPFAMKFGELKKKSNNGGKRSASVFDQDEFEDENQESTKHMNNIGVERMQRVRIKNHQCREDDRQSKSQEGKKDFYVDNDDQSIYRGDTSILDHARRKRRNSDKDDLQDIRKSNWIHDGILVRIISHKIFNGKYYNRKAAINRVFDEFSAEVEVLDSGPHVQDGGAIIKVSQNQVETVIPKEGKKVLILNGKGRGMFATLIKSDKEKFRANLELLDYPRGRLLKNVDFDDFSKVAA